MIFGIKCAVCGLALEHQDYQKDFAIPGHIRSMYWFNPNLSNLHDAVVDFCGPNHATEWYVSKMAAQAKGTEEPPNQ